MKKIIITTTSFLAEKILLNQKENIICTVSGGQDSILLFFLLFHLQKQWNINIQVLHFHHFWQKKNFSSTYQVWKLLFVFKIPFYLVFSENLLENEKKARNWRQSGINRVSTIENSSKIFTGHTASDQLETAVWHLFRGTSPRGFASLKYETILLGPNTLFKNPKFYPLSGSFLFFQKITFCHIPVQSKKQSVFFPKNVRFNTGFKNVSFDTKKQNFFGNENNRMQGNKKKHIKKFYSFLLFNSVVFNKIIIRPLLVLHRNDITKFSQKYLLPVMYDPTNTKLEWSRNRIRHQLFPLVRLFFNPNTEYVVNNFLEISSEEQKYIESSIEKIIQYWLKSYYSEFLVEKNLVKKHDFFTLFVSKIYSQFQTFPKAVQRSLLQKIYKSCTNFQLNSLQIELLRKKASK